MSSIIGLSRTALRYEPCEDEDEEKIRRRMRALAEERRRYGCPRIHMILKREGLVINHKRTERIYYKVEGLSLKVRKRRKWASGVRIGLPEPTKINERWSMDFVHDSLWQSRRFRSLTVVDVFSKESLAIEIDTSLGGQRVVRILEQIAKDRGYPESITVDNGPEFRGQAVDQWAYQHGVKLDFIEPGKPIQNAWIESFNGKYRDECLNEHYFTTLQEARDISEEWRLDYNTFRPHSSLRGLTPEEFVKREQDKINQNMQELALQTA